MQTNVKFNDLHEYRTHHSPRLISTQEHFNIVLPEVTYFADLKNLNNINIKNIFITTAVGIEALMQEQGLDASILEIALAKIQQLKNHDFKQQAEVVLQIDVSDQASSDYIVINPEGGFKAQVKQYETAIIFAKKVAQSALAGTQIFVDLNASTEQQRLLATLNIKWQEMNYCLFDRYPQLKKTHQVKAVPALGFYIKPNEIVSAEVAQIILQKSQATAKGMTLTKDLANLPANICTPQFLVKCADFLAITYGLSLKRLSGDAVLAAGLRSFYSVAQGGNAPAELIVLEKTNPQNSKAAIALVGKGITFDTGGISLKPAEGMDEMKSDMGGAATMFGTLLALLEVGTEHNLVVTLACCENMPSHTATRPGDVVQSLSGQTIEILNTDAEGRLVLCDALTYVQQNYKPKLIIDAATLTGACVVALAGVHAGLYSNHKVIEKDFVLAGEEVLDTVWPMPLDEEYHEMLKSPFADIANIGGRWGGSVTAACFLQKFIENDTPWVHLDIAGVARKKGTDKGSSARPVALLTHYLMHYAS